MNISLGDVVESTGFQDDEVMRSRMFVVYDGSTGDVIHVHRCFGDAQFVADEVHERTAMQLASTAGEYRDLQVLPVHELDVVDGDVALHVDLSSGQAVVTNAPPQSLRGFVAGGSAQAD